MSAPRTVRRRLLVVAALAAAVAAAVLLRHHGYHAAEPRQAVYHGATSLAGMREFTVWLTPTLTRGTTVAHGAPESPASAAAADAAALDALEGIAAWSESVDPETAILHVAAEDSSDLWGLEVRVPRSGGLVTQAAGRITLSLQGAVQGHGAWLRVRRDGVGDVTVQRDDYASENAMYADLASRLSAAGVPSNTVPGGVRIEPNGTWCSGGEAGGEAGVIVVVTGDGP